MKSKISAVLTAALVAAATAASASTASDAGIVKAVRGSYVYRHHLRGDDVTVASQDGVVTLTGSVAAEYRKTLAEDTAAAQTGVLRVDDRLTIVETPPSSGSDAWLAAKVRTVLLFHRSVSAVETKVSAKDGVVTLTGRADSLAQKDLTTAYAGDVEGVKSVDNALKVTRRLSRRSRMERNIDDASITSEVKLTLLFHRSTSAADTRVATANGVVTLSGKAANTAQKDLSEKVASDVAGVKSVTNDIKVE